MHAAAEQAEAALAAERRVTQAAADLASAAQAALVAERAAKERSEADAAAAEEALHQVRAAHAATECAAEAALAAEAGAREAAQAAVACELARTQTRVRDAETALAQTRAGAEAHRVAARQAEAGAGATQAARPARTPSTKEAAREVANMRARLQCMEEVVLQMQSAAAGGSAAQQAAPLLQCKAPAAELLASAPALPASGGDVATARSPSTPPGQHLPRLASPPSICAVASTAAPEDARVGGAGLSGAAGGRDEDDGETKQCHTCMQQLPFDRFGVDYGRCLRPNCRTCACIRMWLARRVSRPLRSTPPSPRWATLPCWRRGRPERLTTSAPPFAQPRAPVRTCSPALLCWARQRRRRLCHRGGGACTHRWPHDAGPSGAAVVAESEHGTEDGDQVCGQFPCSR